MSFEGLSQDMATEAEPMAGVIVKLDRSFPLVRFGDGSESRCELAAALKKSRGSRSQITIGDKVEATPPGSHDMGIIERVLPRKSEFLRRDPVDRAVSQALAANFDRVLIMHPMDRINLKRLERELVLAHATGVDVVVVLTKKDLVSSEKIEELTDDVRRRAGRMVSVIPISVQDPASLEDLRAVLSGGSASILIGSSGAGKSTLVNHLMGEDVRATSEVRAGDGKGRHTTVSRAMLQLPVCGNGNEDEPAYIVDMPGIRGLGLWDSVEGVEEAFSDVVAYARDCRFRDCSHGGEPGCAIMAAVEAGNLDMLRVESYRSMMAELEDMERRRERSGWRN